MRLLSVLVSAATLVGCASNNRAGVDPNVAVTLDPASFQATSLSEGAVYRIGRADKLAIRVLQVPDLSFDEIFVDAAGNLQMPLIGTLQAAGLTTDELAAELTRKLGATYLRDPRVVVTVTQAAGQKVTIDGAVTKPGVYEMRGRTTLLQAVAMAEGATRVADLSRVAVFRTSGTQPTVAVFDMRAVRSGQAVDPMLMGDDVVVVDTSRLSARTQDLLQALPALSSFFFYTR